MNYNYICTLKLLSVCLQAHTSCSLVDAFTSPELLSQKSLEHHLKPLAATNDGGGGGAPATSERKPWELLRFISQSSKFVKPPSLPFVKGKPKRKVLPGETLWTPSSSENFFSFSPLDDVVMGGASSSTIDNNTGIWTGEVTDANNGGFVGVRSVPFKNDMSLDMSECKGITIKLRKGNGLRFKIVIRDSTEFNGVCWTTEFDTVERGTEIRIPFSEQVPTIFANTVEGKVLEDTNIVGFQFALSKFQYDGKLNQKFKLGDFTLQILELKSY